MDNGERNELVQEIREIRGMLDHLREQLERLLADEKREDFRRVSGESWR